MRPLRFFKAFSLMLATVLVAAACSSGANTETFDTDFGPGSAENTDLAGFEMIYKTPADTVLQYEIGTPISDDALAARDRVMKDLNCVITEIHSGTVRESVFSGTFLFDAEVGDGLECVSNASVGMITGLSDSDFIDYTNEEKWGTRTVLEIVYHEDDLYAVIPAFWPEIGVTTYFPILVNENLIAKLGTDDPRDIYENGQWTWDTFESVLPVYYAEEGGSVVHYSFSSQEAIYAEHFIRTNGDRYTEKDKSGNYVLGFTDATTLQAMTKAQQLAQNYKYAIFFHGNGDEDDEVFISGKAVLFSIHSTHTIGANGAISRQCENYGMIPWPTGPNAGEDLCFSCYSHSPVIDIPVNTRDRDATEQIINALYEPMGGMTCLEDLKSYLAKNYFYDNRDMNVYYTMFQNCQYNYWSLDVRNMPTQYVSSADSASVIMDRTRDSFTASFERIVLPHIRGIVSVWGDYE